VEFEGLPNYTTEELADFAIEHFRNLGVYLPRFDTGRLFTEEKIEQAREALPPAEEELESAPNPPAAEKVAKAESDPAANREPFNFTHSNKDLTNFRIAPSFKALPVQNLGEGIPDQEPKKSRLPDFAQHCEAACIKLWGEPERRTKNELRWNGGRIYTISKH